MRIINVKELFKNEISGKVIIVLASIVLIYILISVYFANHFFFNTKINGVDVSLKSYGKTGNTIKSYIKDYQLKLIEREGETEEIIGQDTGIKYNEENSISKTYHIRSPFKWIISLFEEQKYYVNDLFIFNKENLENRINQLNCLQEAVTEPQNVSFKYLNGYYEAVKEVYGNKINKDRLKAVVEKSILEGETKIDLNEKLCYENPKYTLSSHKTVETKNLLNKYIKTDITYIFENEREKLDASTINKWLSVDENLDVIISEIAAMKYVRELSKKYDTVGITRNFKTSTGKIVGVEGGLYGFKSNRESEVKALLNNIRHGEVIEKEPIYTQKALARGEGEIGNTYVEINITRQHLWFYKNGRVIAQGSVITGNVSKGYSTVTGTFMLNYKQKGAILEGPGYSTYITYWMPFFGNTGIHEASWRNNFGGDIYKNYGSHGCVNTPIYLAKTIFDNIEEGTPIICYEE
ncbi:L,D-transpeptidase family protein [Candidatus Clostridium radicumherbarum]|uniref:L,D-transpeptidase family protein n=1 Tax=Candidatus Clostridium radicumherbarum TaxID=3381662 RepID=A0ABW8TN70_9CLOT